MNMNKEQQSKLYLILMEDVCHMCEPLGMYESYKLAMENMVFLKANFPNVHFFIMHWDFADVDSIFSKCMNNLKSLL